MWFATRYATGERSVECNSNKRSKGG
ncbi:MAG: hypothetical protein QOI13_846, partial [Paraburkholderia sp.]|nr:hypothetical protein [Paraburkholderia sp.]